MRSLLKKKEKRVPRKDDAAPKEAKRASQSTAQCCAKISRTVAGCHD